METPRSPGDIMIATNLAGRGTDIKLKPEVNEGGGLFCLLTFLPRNRRVELQAFGRTARCGNPGSAQLILHAASIPHQYRQLDISTIRELRKHQETHRLNEMIKKDVKEVQIRGNLFDEHCKYLKEVHDRLKGDLEEEREVVIDCLNELWGQWLQTKQADITHQRWWEVQIDLSHLQQDWQSIFETSIKLPSENFLHHINLGNKIAKSESDASSAIQHYDQAIAVEKQFVSQSEFTAIAYHNCAYCRICTGGENCIEESIKDLKIAKDLLLKVYVREVFIINQCCNTGGARSDTKSALSKQMHARLDIIHYVASKIDEAHQKLDQFRREKVKVKAVPSTILQLIPEPDLVTTEELRSLSQLGLEFVFDVEKKPRFCWEGLLVFALGLVEVLAGACLIVLTEGAGSSIGMGLISEGVSDCIDGTVGMITGEWSWTQWGVMKAASISVALLTGGVGKFVEEGVEGFKIGLKAFPEAAEHGWTQVAKNSIKDVGEAVGKEGVQQGVIRTLGKIEDSAMEMITKRVAKGVTEMVRVEHSLNKAFSGQNALGVIVDHIVNSSQDKTFPFIKKDAFDFFNQNTHDVISSLVPDTSDTDQFLSCVLDLSNGLSEHLHGMASVFELLEDAVYAAKIADAVKQLAGLFRHFHTRLVNFCKESDQVGQAVTSASNSVELEHHSQLVGLKEELALQTTEAFTEGVESVIMQTLGWVSSQVLNRTVNKKLAHHISEKTIHGISNAIHKAQHDTVHLPAIAEESASIREITSHAKAILKENKSITEGDLQVAVDHYHCQVDIVDGKNRLIHSVKPSSEEGEGGVINLVSDEGNPAKYSVQGDGSAEKGGSTSQHELIEAFTRGLNHSGTTAHHHTSIEVRQAISSQIRESPESYKLHYHRERIRSDMIKVSKDIRNPESFGSSYEAPIIEGLYGIKVKIVDKDGKVLRPGEGSGEEITLVYTEDENHPNGHFDRLDANGHHEEVHSEYGNCFYVAIAKGLKEHGHDLDGTKLREAVAGEIDKNPQRWHEHYQLKKMRIDLIEGAGREENKTTRLKKYKYKYVQVSDKVQEISYKQKNNLKKYDKKPEGDDLKKHPDYLELKKNPKMIMQVTNGARVVKRTIIAEGCNFATNIGCCLTTEPSESQLSFKGDEEKFNKEGIRDKNGSAPVSFHVIGSEAGANAGVLFGNSVVASEHYNRLERVVAKMIKAHVGDRTFKCKATVEMEDLVQPRENMEKMLTEERDKPAVDFSVKVVDHEAFERHLPKRERLQLKVNKKGQRMLQRSPKEQRELLLQKAAEMKSKRRENLKKYSQMALRKSTFRNQILE